MHAKTVNVSARSSSGTQLSDAEISVVVHSVVNGRSEAVYDAKENPLHTAAENRDFKEVMKLIEARKKEHAKRDKNELGHIIASYVNDGENRDGATPLHRLASSAFFGEQAVQVAEVLIAEGASVDSVDNDQSTPMHRCLTGFREFAQEVPLQMDVRGTHFNNLMLFLGCLVEKGASIDSQYNVQTVLQRADLLQREFLNGEFTASINAESFVAAYRRHAASRVTATAQVAAPSSSCSCVVL